MHPSARRPPMDLWLADLAGSGAVLRELASRLGMNALGGDPPAGPGSGEAASVAEEKLLARIAVRALLVGYVGLEAASAPFRRGPQGKPSLAPAADVAPLEFSYSHASRFVLVAVSGSAPLGVDVEEARPVRLSAVRRDMLEAAAAALDPARPLPMVPPEARFIQAWVRLEALAKATGEGVASLLGRLRDGPAALAATTLAGQRVVVRDLSIAGPEPCFAAVAGPHPILAESRHAPTVARMPLDPDWLRAWTAGEITRPDTSR